MKHETGSGYDRCETVRPLLSLMVDGEATAEETVLAKTHLSGCERCMSHFVFLQAIASSLKNVPSNSPPAALFERVALSTYARPTLWDRVREFLLPAPTRVAVGSVFAVGIVGLGLVPVLNSLNSSHTFPTAKIPTSEVAGTELSPKTELSTQSEVVKPKQSLLASNKLANPKPANSEKVSGMEQKAIVASNTIVPKSVVTSSVLNPNRPSPVRNATKVASADIDTAVKSNVDSSITSISSNRRQIARLNAPSSLARPMTSSASALEPVVISSEPTPIPVIPSENTTERKTVARVEQPETTMPIPEYSDSRNTATVAMVNVKPTSPYTLEGGGTGARARSYDFAPPLRRVALGERTNFVPIAQAPTSSN